MILENHCSIQAGAVDLLSRRTNEAGSRRIKTSEYVQESRFSTARMANETNKLALLDLEIDLDKGALVFSYSSDRGQHCLGRLLYGDRD